jgi:translation initiation factor eIF-2B subunit epsilon
MGDAFRELDARQVLHSDFIVISADTVSNLNLLPILEKHRERRKTGDKNAIMTVILRQASNSHRTRSKAQEQIFIVDSYSNQLLEYQEYVRYPSKKRVEFDSKFFKLSPKVSVRNDLIDTRIDICSLEVNRRAYIGPCPFH